MHLSIVVMSLATVIIITLTYTPLYRIGGSSIYSTRREGMCLPPPTHTHTPLYPFTVYICRGVSKIKVSAPSRQDSRLALACQQIQTYLTNYLFRSISEQVTLEY